MFVCRLTEPIDLFDGLTPLHEWIGSDAERTAWALRAVLALADAAPKVGWQGKMRHLPAVGVLPDPPYTADYLVAKQDNNGDTFLISDSSQVMLFSQLVTVETKHRDIGSGTAPTTEEMRDALRQNESGPESVPEFAPSDQPF